MTTTPLAANTLALSTEPAREPKRLTRTAWRHRLAKATVAVFDPTTPTVPVIAATFKSQLEATNWADDVARQYPACPVIILDHTGIAKLCICNDQRHAASAAKAAESIWLRSAPNKPSPKPTQLLLQLQ